jgi:hypothetical protein
MRANEGVAAVGTATGAARRDRAFLGPTEGEVKGT